MKRVVVGLSGGVDSSVAALLLKEQGYDVIGLFMRNWEEEDENGRCTAEDDYADVRSVCTTLGIPYYTVNFAKEYMERVFARFLEDYAEGRTPNPDVLCNREIKFGPFLERAAQLGADLVATGHYCGVKHENGLNYLMKAKDASKDQTYFLCEVSGKQLENVIFPLSRLLKSEVREIALKNRLSIAGKKDSTGICFIGERKFRQFLSGYLPASPGNIIDIRGNKVGRHEGLMYYTLGQRRGLGLGGTSDSQERWFVVEKDLKRNVLVVSHGDEAPLMSKALSTGKVNWIPLPPEKKTFQCTAKFRYRQPEQRVTVTVEDGRAYVEFEKKQRAVTEGQYAVFYRGEYCLGGGVIEKVYK